MALSPADRPHLGRGYSLRLADDPNDCWLMNGSGHEILLNDTASEILRRCDGHHSITRLIEEMQRLYVGASTDEISEAVTGFLELALSKGWIEMLSTTEHD